MPPTSPSAMWRQWSPTSWPPPAPRSTRGPSVAALAGLSRRRAGDRSQDEAQWPTAVLPALGRRASTTSGVKLLSCRSGTAPGRVPARAGRGVSHFGTGARRRGPGGSESANATVFVHPDFPQQEPAAILLDHATVGVQNDAVVEVGSELVPEDLAEPDIFPTSFLAVLPNPAPDRRQSGRLGKVLEAIGQAKHLQLAFRNCSEERVHPGVWSRNRSRLVPRPRESGTPGEARPSRRRSIHSRSEPGALLGCRSAARCNPRFRLRPEVP